MKLSRKEVLNLYVKYIKRFLDIILSIFALIILSPIILIVILAIKIESKGPAIFKQKRLGQYGKEFEILKLRSMCIGAEQKGSGQYSYKNDPRVTKVGKIIRACSIDEFPQFINIIKGDMSLIGFRPPLTYHPCKFDEYTQTQKKMFDMKPGITGWAQIHGRKTLSWERRIEYSIWYTENVSLWLDIKITILTIIKILVNSDNENIGKTVK